MIKNKILIIDQDMGFVETASQLLEKNGYEIVCAHGGSEGLGCGSGCNAPDLAIIDVVLANQIQAGIAGNSAHALKGVPVIMVAAPGYASMAGTNAGLMVKSVMEKPVNPQELLQAVRTYISRSGEKHRAIVEEVTKLVKSWEGKKGSLIMILHELQNHYGYVPRDVAFVLSQILDVPMAQIYEVITFYNFFKLTPPGRNTISICMGTACYLKGAPQLIEEFKKELNVGEGETTKDGLFSLQIVRCLGCCGLSPVVMVNGKIYGKVTRDQIKAIVDTYRKG